MQTVASGHPAAVQGSTRLSLTIRGAVQGVGFRPFVFRLVSELGLAGWVSNAAHGASVEVEGAPDLLDQFLARLERDGPPHARILGMESHVLDPVGYTAFTIRASQADGVATAVILPDLATCADCLREILDPGDRRYRYPFTNCTNCGPRFSIVEALPYDRPNTTMRHFPMCPRCRAEYEDPLDRRFHAQPIACPDCGPQLASWNGEGRVLAGGDAALRLAVNALRRGEIVAAKGLGGFHLLVDARDDAAVTLLRRRKHREEKPFALIFPSLEAVRQACAVSPEEERLLLSPESPIVLLRRKPDQTMVAEAVAPHCPVLGVMLPYTPLHHLLLRAVDCPLVATSGNLSDEPICTDEHDALARLGPIADLLLVHDRPIARHMDDSIARVAAGRPLLLRRARGYAPLPIPLSVSLPIPLLAVGGHLKNTVALSVGDTAVLSQHIGDLNTLPARAAFERAIVDLERLYRVSHGAVACDLHPDYASTVAAQGMGLPLAPVQHHVAHVLACLAEHQLDAPALGVAWDGTGYGADGTIWGGEFFQIAPGTITRVAHLRTFALPGGERAVRQPWRTAIGLLHECFGEEAFAMRHLAPLQQRTPQELAVMRAMLGASINAPRNSSMGRLFDGVAAILGLCQAASYEGQAAMELEWALVQGPVGEHYELAIVPESRPGGMVVDWTPLLRAMLRDLLAGVPVGCIAWRFHEALLAAVVTVARLVGEEWVVLSGGCFQNAYLLEGTVGALRQAGFRPLWHLLVPPNDGGIALGQLAAAAKRRDLRDVSGDPGADYQHRRR